MLPERPEMTVGDEESAGGRRGGGVKVKLPSEEAGWSLHAQGGSWSQQRG